MCRAEAHKLFSRKPIFDALGIQLFAVVHEHIESEVKDFWPRYWGGVVLFDRGRDFFKALGGGYLLKEKFFIERNFGDWAPLAEVIEICTQLQVIVL
ncbi:uncharacterized protein [Cicer arietinum]|uniref:uncharacterized protein n=1 Tax=Cicer arietinum TaxID=3827 RepID=UPI0006418373